MSKEWREVLVNAALNEHRQIRYSFHDHSALSGECALGVLHLATHGYQRPEALSCPSVMACCINKFGLSVAERDEIATRNDRGEDFLAIARKVAYEDETLG